MEDHSRLKLNPRDRQFLETSAAVIFRARQSLTLDDRLKTGKKPNLPYADHHCEFSRNTKDISPKRRSGNFLGKAKEEELVRYMSKLPSYLERGETCQEKVLNVGVLDWGHLEKWQYSQKHIPHRRLSLSSANSSSSLSTEESSIDSSGGRSWSPAHNRTGRASLQSHLLSSPADFKQKDSALKINSENGTFDRPNLDALQSMKVNRNSQDGETVKRVNNLQEQKAYDVKPGVAKKGERVTLLMPGDLTRGQHSLIPESTTIFGSDVPYSCPLRCGIDEFTKANCCSSESDSINVLPNSSRSVPNPARTGSSPTHGRISDIRRTTRTTAIPASKEPSMGLDPKVSKVATEKRRSTSPFRRLSISIGKIGKTFNSKEDSAVPNSQGNSSDMQSATSRARSSPLRRLLDPLLKPKPQNYHTREPLQRDTGSTECRSSNGNLYSSTGARQSGIVKFDMASCREIEIEDSSREKKQGYQALLRVAIKNGQPLFTFAVDNERNILAATLKKLSSSRDDDYRCVYTFFAIQEVKKKNGRWINHGGKDNYIPNVVAQLKVSGSQFSCMTRENYVERSFAREFVLFAVDLQQAERPAVDFQPNDELAAIVVKIPKVIGRNWTGEGGVSSVQSIINATVILPSGVHTLPNKGGPSSLIQRWRSGGSCDCGGWDLGCELQIFANQKQPIKNSSTSKACSISEKFELIPQGGEEENHPVFSLAPFKDGIYSVEFTSSFSILQAFSLCIAVLDSKNLCQISESSSLSEGKTSLENILAQNDGTRTSSGGEGDVPVRYVSYPPHSPVGRV